MLKAWQNGWIVFFRIWHFYLCLVIISIPLLWPAYLIKAGEYELFTLPWYIPVLFIVWVFIFGPLALHLSAEISGHFTTEGTEKRPLSELFSGKIRSRERK